MTDTNVRPDLFSLAQSAVVYLVVFLVLAALPMYACQAQIRENKTEQVKIVSAGRERASLTLEIAADGQTQARGLMHRKSLPRNHGMIFIFPEDEVAGFWMKNTLIPLDIIFVDRDGRIIKIYPMAKPGDLTRISSEFPCRAVIEIAGGQAKALKLNLGDLVLSPSLDIESRPVAEE